MWVYKTAKFIEDERQHGLKEFVENRSRRISDATTRAQAARLAKPYAGFLVTRHRNMRLIGDVRLHRDREVFVWYEVLPRGGEDYKVFSRYSQTIETAHFDRVDFERWYAEQSIAEAEALRPTPLPENFSGWLEALTPIFSSADWDAEIILETGEWITSMASIQEVQWPEVYQLVLEMTGQFTSWSQDEKRLRTTSGLELVAQRTSAKTLSLLGIAKDDTSLSGRPIRPVPIGDDALRHARRAYPSWLLAEDALWYAVQRGTSQSLALSPEEQQLLSRVAGKSSEGTELPMFINGQAGSGKSTMLAYVFAGLCKLSALQSLGGRPLFITYNAQLLQKARQTTQSLLRTHFDSRNPFGEIELDSLFMTWRDLLVSLLDEDDRSNFPPEKRVDYHDFSLAWNRDRGRLSVPNFNRPQFDAETAWYVIRSLIKGSDFEGELTPDDYSVELSRDEQTVSLDDYTRIYTQVYNGWYQQELADKSLWDDQDLTSAAFEALSRRSQLNDIAALVIDEAQDFTRRELRLITRTTVYSDYAIHRTGTGTRPPIVFAGDPLQTLSPTGFRWSAIKAGIYEELQGMFGPEARQPVFAELLNNYRSSAPIVRVANTVQLWRSVLFDIGQLQPQGAWRPATDGSPPYKFILEDIDEEDFIKFVAQTVIIVPCEDGGEINFVRNDPLLSRIYPDASESNPPEFVFSSASIKGLEYEKIVLYKFGEAATDVNWNPERDAESRALQDEYFFNKLYVALTRATTELYVADSVLGDTALWTHLEQRRRDELHRRATAKGITSFALVDLGAVEAGLDDLQNMQEANPRENAEKTKRYAFETRSARKMRQAGSYFRKARDLREASECEAWALRYDGQVLEAATQFVLANQFDEAWRCFWEAQSWQDLGDVAATTDELPALERAAVLFMTTSERTVDDLQRFARDIIRLDDLIQPCPTWTSAVDQLCIDIKALPDNVDSDTLQRLANALQLVHDTGHRQAGLSAAVMYNRAGDRRTASRILDRMTGPMTADRARAYQQVLGVPEALEHLLAANLHAVVRDEWFAADRPMDEEWIIHVLPTLTGTEHFDERMKLLLSRGDVDRAIDSLLSLPRWTEANITSSNTLLEQLAEQGEIVKAIEFANTVIERNLGNRVLTSMLVDALVGFAHHLHEYGWPTLSGEDRQAVRTALNTVYDTVPLKTWDPMSIPALGAMLEKSGYLRRSLNVYQHFGEHHDKAIAQYCRHRFLAASTQLLKDTTVRGDERSAVQRRQHELASKWRLNLNQSNHPIQLHFHRELDRGGVTTEISSPPVEVPTAIGPVKWELTKQGAELALNLIDDSRDLLARLRIRLDGGDPKAVGGDIAVNEDLIEWTVESVTVKIQPSTGYSITVIDEGEEIGQVDDLLAALVPGTAASRTAPPTKRTAGAGTEPRNRSGRGRRVRRQPLSGASTEKSAPSGGAGTKVYKLARELKLPQSAVMAAGQTLGMRTDRGDSHLSFGDAMRLREHLRNSSPEDISPPSDAGS